MKILVIGAAGKTGKAVVEQALAAGHTVTAFVHDESDFSESAVLRVVKGDATNRADMDQAVRGQDAVLGTLGGTPVQGDDSRSKRHRHHTSVHAG